MFMGQARCPPLSSVGLAWGEAVQKEGQTPPPLIDEELAVTIRAPEVDKVITLTKAKLVG